MNIEITHNTDNHTTQKVVNALHNSRLALPSNGGITKQWHGLILEITVLNWARNMTDGYLINGSKDNQHIFSITIGE